MRPRFLLPLVLPAVLAAGSPARAAEDTDGCTYFIDALPAVADQPGVWCASANLVHTADTYAALSVTVPGVTVDCLGHVLDGSSLPVSNGTSGINAQEVAGHVIIRNCDLRGFGYGVLLYGGGTVEDSTVIRARLTGIHLQGERMFVRRNRVLNTGGNIYVASGISVFGEAEVVDNDVDGVTAPPGSLIGVHGIVASQISDAESVVIARNRIAGLHPDGDRQASGITLYVPGKMVVRDNVLFGSGVFNSTGLYCQSVGPTAITRNVVLGFTYPFYSCTADGGNTTRD